MESEAGRHFLCSGCRASSQASKASEGEQVYKHPPIQAAQQLQPIPASWLLKITASPGKGKQFEDTGHSIKTRILTEITPNLQNLIKQKFQPSVYSNLRFKKFPLSEMTERCCFSYT